ncbi:MAG: radical SAM protein [Candidatus Shapirobacteria bacterium]
MHNISPKTLALTALKYPKTAIDITLDPFLFNDKATPFPRLINCFITEACNFKCPMCHVVNSREMNKSHIPFSDFKKIVLESKKYRPSFQLAGGEPLLHPDLIKMIKLLNDNHMVNLVVTNGLLLEEKAQQIIDSGLDYLAISLDGPDEETQYQRGYVKGSFDKIVKGIKKVVKLRGSKTFPHIRIATVISKYNLHNFEKILNLAEDLGVDQWSLSHHYYYFKDIKDKQDIFTKKHNLKNDIWGEYIGNSRNFLTEKERKSLNKKIDFLKNYQPKNNLKIVLPSNLDIEKYYSGANPGKNSKCISPYRQVYIRGNGNIEICQGNIIGNAKNDGIYNSWHSKTATHFREIFKKYPNMPGCFRCCSLDIKFD